ncbi:right-handed parallel beta-helix repeat-containing protein [Cohnella herbarum]|uniref:Right-handed parallel beta-helix repeat-containing protein n=1 Tax=Cohnella herbarum TaxID=2728023 RepID=A0A7Z2VN82_9BACL|nr:right-handed parallel beta-helix repeat-containing protein [Cohnella herbarum]QJD86426.1 right-handed parallel beta-helix repeat-containing protein [Cohnella herbarum]
MLHKHAKFLLAMAILLVVSSMPSVFNGVGHAAVQAEFYVSPIGNDSNPGSSSQPFATIQKARDTVRSINGNMTGDIVVYLSGGTYTQSSTIQFEENATVRDSGTNGFNVVYRALPGESPVISGGVAVSNWSVHDAAKNIYKAFVGVGVKTRQLYVDGERATRARGDQDPAGFKKVANGFTAPSSGLYANMSSWGNASQIEIVTLKAHPWQMTRCGVASISVANLTMKQNCWSNAQLFDGISWIENAYELLDAQGEWYLNETTGYLYYIPTPTQNIMTAQVVLPTLEKLMSVKGTIGTPIRNLRFEGLTFAYGTWLRPSGNDGYADAQGGFTFVGAPSLSNINKFTKNPGNVELAYAHSIQFIGNTFKHLGAAALDIGLGSQGNNILGNRFMDISAGGITVGDVSPDGHHPSDVRMQLKNTTIRNNFITNVGIEFYDAVGICLFYTINTVVDHNEISNTPWSGFSSGAVGYNVEPGGAYNYTTYPYTDNLQVTNNKIYNVMLYMKDGGGIYTSGRHTNSLIANNYVYNQAHDQGAIYLDDGTAFVEVRNNVVRTAPFWVFLWNTTIHDNNIHDNFTDTATFRNDGLNNSITNTTVIPHSNWPQQALDIMQTAGLEDSYSGIRTDSSRSINEDVWNTATSGTWNSNGSRPGDLFGNVKYTTVNESALEYTFVGTGIGYITENNIDMGNVDVYIDGVYQQTVNCYAPTKSTQKLMFSVTNLTHGKHTIKLVKKDGTYMLVDGFKVYSNNDLSPMAPAVPSNLVLGKVPASSVPFYNLPVISDGVTSNTNNYTDSSPHSGLQWVQFDLGSSFNLSQVRLWHFYGDARTYRDVIVQLSTTPDFSSGVVTVFNNDSDNSAGQGVGTDAEYVETASGKVIPFASANARYVRLWSNGNSVNAHNHYVEVEIL